MPTSDVPAEEYYRQVRDAVDNYQETVATLLAFAAFVCHDGISHRAGSAFGFGRRMTTTAVNTISPNADVTPDCVAQMDDSYGIVAEVKKSLSSDQSHWARYSQQLRKYDDGLLGWWTESETVSSSNAVMLIHQSRGRAYVRHLESLKQADETQVGPNTVVVEFNRSDEGRAYIFFRKEWGNILPAPLAARLDQGVQVPRDKVQESFPVLKFYDSPPPEEELLKTLWMDVFHASYNPSMALTEDGVHHIGVTVDAITDELQRAYGSQKLRRDTRSAEFPKKAWIKQALDRLVALDLATAGTDAGAYTIKYKPFPKGDVLERFCRLTRRMQSRRSVALEQLTLPLVSAPLEPNPEVEEITDSRNVDDQTGAT